MISLAILVCVGAGCDGKKAPASKTGAATTGSAKTAPVPRTFKRHVKAQYDAGEVETLAQLAPAPNVDGSVEDWKLLAAAGAGDAAKVVMGQLARDSDGKVLQQRLRVVSLQSGAIKRHTIRDETGQEAWDQARALLGELGLRGVGWWRVLWSPNRKYAIRPFVDESRRAKRASVHLYDGRGDQRILQARELDALQARFSPDGETLATTTTRRQSSMRVDIEELTLIQPAAEKHLRVRGYAAKEGVVPGTMRWSRDGKFLFMKRRLLGDEQPTCVTVFDVGARAFHNVRCTKGPERADAKIHFALVDRPARVLIYDELVPEETRTIDVYRLRDLRKLRAVPLPGSSLYTGARPGGGTRFAYELGDGRVMVGVKRFCSLVYPEAATADMGADMQQGDMGAKDMGARDMAPELVCRAAPLVILDPSTGAWSGLPASKRVNPLDHSVVQEMPFTESRAALMSGVLHGRALLVARPTEHDAKTLELLRVHLGEQTPETTPGEAP